MVAIIGGALLGLALTRPRLGWAERLEESSRQLIAILTTVLAFVTGGYAYGSLYLALHRQLGSEVDKLLRGAGVFFAIYAMCIHFEPFAGGEGWRERGTAIILYISVVVAAVLGGLVFVEYTLNNSVESWSTLVRATAAVAGCYGLYWYARRGKHARRGSAKVENASAEPMPSCGEP